MSQLRLDIFRRILDPLPREPLVDLGAGHCKFSRIANEMGFPVASVDARDERVPEDISWPFLQRDVRFFDLRPYRIVCCLGLLYHLELFDQTALLVAASHPGLLALIVDTHTSPAVKQTQSDARGNLYEGKLFEETPTDPRASVGNDFSFWHTEESLRRLFENYEYKAEKIEPEHVPGRAFWVATR